MTETVLIVDPDVASQAAMVDLLRAAGYGTIVADGFVPAVQLLDSARPDLLITVVRLGEFNGLELVIRGRNRNPRMAAIVVDNSRDAVLERESEKVGAAAYLAKPVGSNELLRKAAEALAGRDRRRWSRATLAVDMPVRIAAERARLHDISYGGFRLEFRRGCLVLPPVLSMELPNIGLSVEANRVWQLHADPPEVSWCGAALALMNSATTRRRWWKLVESLRETGASSPWSRAG